MLPQPPTVHWWLFVTVVPLLVALDHGIRWLGEGSVPGSSATLTLAPLTREETLLSLLFPSTSIVRTLLAFLAVGLALRCFGRSRVEHWLCRGAFILLAAGSLGNWLDQVLFFRATVPLRLSLPGAFGTFAFSLGDGYLIASLLAFSLSIWVGETRESNREHSNPQH